MRLFLIFACLAFGLSACASDKNPRRLCPQVASLRELDRLEDHGRDPVQPDTLVAVATMKKIEGRCTYQGDGVEIEFDLMMEAEKGPRLGGARASFSYFVSVLDPQDGVLGKEVMTQEFVFEEEASQTEARVPLRIFLPLEEDQDASHYRVLTGFQLTPEQLEQVRESGQDKK